MKKTLQKIQLIDTINRAMLHSGKCIFSTIAKTNTFEWFNLATAKTMDEEYYLSQSGYKPISILYQNLLKTRESKFVATTDNVDTYVTTPEGNYIALPVNNKYLEALKYLSDVIINKYKDKWDRLYDAWNKEYTPIENYSMNEETSVERSKTTDDDLSGSNTLLKTGTVDNDTTHGDTITHNTDVEDTIDETNTKTESGKQLNTISGTPVDKVYPSFSNTSQPIKETVQDTKQETTFTDRQTEDKRDATNTSDIDETTSHTGTTKLKQTFDTSDSNTSSSNRDINEDETITTSHTRSGNIGVTTSQQMLQSEIDLRNNFNFVDQMYRDVDKILTMYIW